MMYCPITPSRVCLTSHGGIDCDVVMGAYRSVLDDASNGEAEEHHYLTVDKVFSREEQ